MTFTATVWAMVFILGALIGTVLVLLLKGRPSQEEIEVNTVSLDELMDQNLTSEEKADRLES